MSIELTMSWEEIRMHKHASGAMSLSNSNKISNLKSFDGSAFKRTKLRRAMIFSQGLSIAGVAALEGVSRASMKNYARVHFPVPKDISSCGPVRDRIALRQNVARDWIAEMEDAA